MASHIVLQEIGEPFDMERVDLKAKKTSTGDFWEINPKGYVPVLEISPTERLTEGAAILQYLGDKNPTLNLAPKAGTMERYRLQEWLNYIATEVHKGFSPLWNSKNSDETKAMAKENLLKKFDYLNTQLATKPFLMGSHFTIADAYLFTVLNWANSLKIDLSKWTNIVKYLSLISERKSVQAALKAEGLLKAA
jgi:glutathione S-transferase